MNFYEKPDNLQLLQKLLSPEKENSSDSDEDDDHLPKCGVQHYSPSDLAKSVTNKATTTSGHASSTTGPLVSSNQLQMNDSQAKSSDLQSINQQFKNAEPQPQTLEKWEEQEALLNEQELDKRSCPNYQIIYKQSVAPEDIYLQMSNKTPTTSSCEEMCLEIAMPEENIGIDGMDLKISGDSIDLKTPVYRLKLPLVQSVDPDRGRAIWDNERKMLILTLRMKRQYDFINF